MTASTPSRADGHMKTHNIILAALGGRQGAARLTDNTPTAVDKWRQNGIPPKHWSAIVALTDGFISYEDLAAVKAAVDGQDAA